MSESFRKMLTGGHPNSLGRTIEVVDIVLNDSEKLKELYECYFSADEVVRLRTSNALKRISKVEREWLVPYIDDFIEVISAIDQASTRWTLADLFSTLANDMTGLQIRKAKKILKNNLSTQEDWIVLNNTMQTLAEWSKSDSKLKQWLIPQLKQLCDDNRKSVSRRAAKLLKVLKH